MARHWNDAILQNCIVNDIGIALLSYLNVQPDLGFEDGMACLQAFFMFSILQISFMSLETNSLPLSDWSSEGHTNSLNIRESTIATSTIFFDVKG